MYVITQCSLTRDAENPEFIFAPVGKMLNPVTRYSKAMAIAAKLGESPNGHYVDSNIYSGLVRDGGSVVLALSMKATKAARRLSIVTMTYTGQKPTQDSFSWQSLYNVKPSRAALEHQLFAVYNRLFVLGERPFLVRINGDNSLSAFNCRSGVWKQYA